jgi:hypothetical protein
MDPYQLTALVFIFLGVMVVLALLDRRRRTELAHFEQLQQTLVACLQSMQTCNSSIEGQSAQLARALSDLQKAVEAAARTAASSVSADTATASHSAATKLTEAVKSASQDVLQEAQRTTEAVQALQTSLEASVKF